MKTKSKTKTKAKKQTTLAAMVAGEDLAIGDYVAILNETVDVPSFLWDTCSAGLAPHDLVRLKVMPREAGQPLKVLSVCLPFVYAKAATGVTRTLDTRQCQLVRLHTGSVKRVWKKLRSQRKLSDSGCSSADRLF